MKKTLKSALSVLLVAIMLFSTISVSFAVDDSDFEERNQKIAEFVERNNHLFELPPAESETLETSGVFEKNALIGALLDYGWYNTNNTNYIFFYYPEFITINGTTYDFQILYKRDTRQIFLTGCDTDFNTFCTIYLDTTEIDGYMVAFEDHYIGYEIFGHGFVTPSSYPYTISFEKYDEEAVYYNFSSHIDTTVNDRWNRFTELTIKYCSELMYDEAGMNLGNFGFTKLYTPTDFSTEGQRYTITYNANGGENAPEPQQKKHNRPIYLSEQIPTREGYKFVGWDTDPTSYKGRFSPGMEWIYEEDVTLYAIWSKVVFNEEYNEDLPRIKIKNNPRTLEVYQYTEVTLSLETYNLPDGAYAVWYNGDKEVSSEAHSVIVGMKSLYDCLIVVKLFDKDGNLITTPDGKYFIGDYIEIKVKTGFFDRVIGFFKYIFGANEYVL